MKKGFYIYKRIKYYLIFPFDNFIKLIETYILKLMALYYIITNS